MAKWLLKIKLFNTALFNKVSGPIMKTVPSTTKGFIVTEHKCSNPSPEPHSLAQFLPSELKPSNISFNYMFTIFCNFNRNYIKLLKLNC